VEALLKQPGDERTLATAGTWADEMRRNPAYDWAKPLHYVNVPLDAERVDLQRDCPAKEAAAPANADGNPAISQKEDASADGECVLGAIERFTAVLRDDSATPAQKSEALKFVIHFIEDLHQPLHVSYAKDRGGNMISLSFMGKPGANLHRVWDTDLIEQRLKDRQIQDWMAWAVELRDRVTPELAIGWGETAEPLLWADESFAITRQLYKNLPQDGNVDAAYVNRWMPTVEERLQMAGVRLAQHLNAIFDPPVPAPADQAEPATRPESRAGETGK
jgi:hypothetical protein